MVVISLWKSFLQKPCATLSIFYIVKLWRNRRQEDLCRYDFTLLCHALCRGHARYTKSIYALSRSIVWSLLCYFVRNRDHCCVLCDVAWVLFLTWYIVHQPTISRCHFNLTNQSKLNGSLVMPNSVTKENPCNAPQNETPEWPLNCIDPLPA